MTGVRTEFAQLAIDWHRTVPVLLYIIIQYCIISIDESMVREERPSVGSRRLRYAGHDSWLSNQRRPNLRLLARYLTIYPTALRCDCCTIQSFAPYRMFVREGRAPLLTVQWAVMAVVRA